MQALKVSRHTQPAMQTPPKTATEPETASEAPKQPAMQTPPKTATEPETASEAPKCPKLARPKRLKRTMSVAFPEELDLSSKAEEEVAKAEEVLAEAAEVLAKVEEEVAKADEVLAKVAAEAAKAEAAKSEEATNELPDPTVSDSEDAAMAEDAKAEDAKAEDAKAEDVKTEEDVKAEPANEDAKAQPDTNNARAFVIDVVASLYAHNFVERIMSVLRGKRISPDAFVALCDALEDLPQVDIPTSTTPYERAVKHMLMMDKLREAALEARSKAYQAWEKSKWGQAHIDNFAVIDGVAKQEDGTVIQDACAICAVSKSECVKPSEHFGERGESPPDAQC